MQDTNTCIQNICFLGEQKEGTKIGVKEEKKKE